MSMFFNAMIAAAAKKDEDFTIDLAITDSNLQFGVTPYWNTGGYCNLDWGDGTVQAATTSGTALTHSYAEAGSYRVKVRGGMYRFRVGSTNPAAVIDCNGNWEALGEITSGDGMFLGTSNAVFSLTSVPTTLIIGRNMFSNCSARISLTTLPPGLTNALNMFASATHAVLNLDVLVANALPGAWESLTNVGTICRMAGTGNTPNSVTGSIARFFRRCPNATNALGAFSFTVAQVWGDYTDYFEITLTTTEANQSWGFTATSNAGNWYCVQWENGENTAGYGSFTSGEKVTHTFATPGTYHIKLATAPCTIVFDQYDSDNGNYEALGWPIDGATGVFVKEGTTTVSSAMTMSGATITSGQSQNVYNYGSALYTVVESGGSQRVSAGGFARDTVVGASGRMYVYSGGTASGATIDGGRLQMTSGGVVRSVTLQASGVIAGVESGASAYDVTCLDSQTVTIAGFVSGLSQMSTLQGQVTVNSGGTALAVTIHRYLYNSGYVSGLVLSGTTGFGVVYPDGLVEDCDAYRPLTVSGSANDVRVQASRLTIIGGATVSGITVNSGGAMTVSSGASALAVTSNAGAVVTVMDGGYIEYA